MRHLLVGTILILLAACDDQASRTSSEVPTELPESLYGKRLLFLGTHPDDEWGLMPVLAEACLFHDATCHFVSTTPAEMGCLETMGLIDFEACAAHRRREFEASAAIAHGTTEVLGWQDLFYAHDGEGLRRNLAQWGQANGGRDALVDAILDVLRRNRPEVVFALDPRHGVTCNPNHRATSLLLSEALERLPPEDRPRVLFENTYNVYERMTPEMYEAIDRGAMYPWPDRDDPNLFYDGTRILPDGRRAVDLQLETIRAYASQFPGLPEDATIDADPERLRIPLVDLADIDPTEELCTPLELSEYKTIDKTLEFVGRKYAEIAEASAEPHAFRLVHEGEAVGEYGALEAWPHRVESDFPEKGVRLTVAAETMEKAEAARAKYLQHVMRFVEAPP